MQFIYVTRNLMEKVYTYKLGTGTPLFETFVLILITMTYLISRV
jgi:hypothetical protein